MQGCSTRRIVRRSPLATAVAALLAGVAAAQVPPVSTTIVVDAIPGNPAAPVQPDQAPLPDGGTRFTLGEAQGYRPGGAAGINLLQSFSDFQLAAGDVALFTANPLLTTENIIARVTGGSVSNIYGTIASDIAGVNLFFLNPAGVFFGQSASLDVQGSFHASTADVLRMQAPDGTPLLAFSGDSALALAHPAAFGFLNPQPAAITVDGATLSVIADDVTVQPPPRDVSLVGGDITLRPGSALLTQTGRILLASAASAGDVLIGDAAPRMDSVAELGTIVLDGASLYAEGVVPCCDLIPDGGSIEIEAHDLVVTESSLATGLLAFGGIDVRLRGDLDLAASDISTTFADLSISADDISLRGVTISSGSGFPSANRNNGGVRIAAAGDLFVDGSISSTADTFSIDGLAFGGSIDLTAGGLLTLRGEIRNYRNDISLRAGEMDIDAGLDVQGSGFIDIEATGPIRMTGSLTGSVGNVSQGSAGTAARIASGGDVTLDKLSASFGGSSVGGGEITVSGVNVRVRNSSFEARGQGNSSFIGSASVEMLDTSFDGSAVTSFGSSDQRGGDVDIVAPRVLLDGVRIETSAVRSALGGATTAGGSIDVNGDQVTITGGSVLESTGVGFVETGSIRLTASEWLLVDGSSRISTTISGVGENLTQLAPTIVLTAPEIRLLDGVRVTSEAFDEGQNARSILIEARDGLELRGATVTAAAEFGGGGGIQVLSDGLINSLDSTVETRVQTSTGNAGNILVDGGSVVLNRARVVASAVEGDGGGILLSGSQVLVSADSVLDASSQVGTDGVVTIDAPDVNLDSGLAALTTDFLDPSRLLRPSCDVADTAQGSFAVRMRAGTPVSPEELLVAFEAPAPAAGGGGATVAVRGGAAVAASGAAFRGGRFGEAALEGARAAEAAAARGDAMAEAAALGVLGNAQTARGDVAGAQANLTRGIKVAVDAADYGLAAELSNDLGNHWSARQEEDQALAAYRRAAQLAREAGDVAGEARALANAGRAALRGGDAGSAQALLGDARARLAAVGRGRTDLQIHLARSYTELAEAGAARDASLVAAHALLTDAAVEARTAGDARTLSYALGNTGRLYELEGRTQEGLYLTRQALHTAEPLDAAELLYRWHWQSARLLETDGQLPAALDAYRRAIELLEESRQETLARYGDAELNFRRAVAPVYREFVDLLLQAPDSAPDLAARLQEARGTMELLKGAELRDYFKNACIAELEARTESLDAIAGSQAAIIYPVQLDDRLELLVSSGGTLYRARSDVPAAQVEATAQAFRGTLQRVGSDAWREQSRQLYDWIMRPLEPILARTGAKTLVFVPGGALRAIPMAALHDGQQFLVERFALAVTPSLNLIDPEPLDRASIRMFAAGISESVRGQSALPNVPAELTAIQGIFGGVSLLDAQFQVERVAQAIQEQRPTIVHIASHGVFTGDPEQSYLLAYDAPLTMERLGEIIGVARFRQDPLALLVLSACQTAEGDDRAALGLAGVAIRAGARSAMGSLWSIADDATMELIKQFYRQIQTSDASRAEALRQAQLALLQQERFQHPFFWSPFLVINNWL